MAKVDTTAVLSVPTDPPPPWLVPGFICKGTVTLLAGEAGAGKSFLSYSLGLALATGRDFLGAPTQPHRVLYFDDENSQPDSQAYLRFLWRGLGKPSLELVKENLNIQHFTLTKAGSSWHLVFRKLVDEVKPNLIVIDTAASCCSVQNENDNGEALNTLAKLRSAAALSPDCSLWVLKHAKLDTEAGKWTVRGAKAWVSATDATLIHSVYKGPEPKNGYRVTQINPQKVREYSLKQGLILHPIVQELTDGRSVSIKANPKKSKMAEEGEGDS